MSKLERWQQLYKLAQEWTDYRINGKLIPRIPAGIDLDCSCQVKENEFHLLGCGLEFCPCCGKIMKECTCFEDYPEDC